MKYPPGLLDEIRARLPVSDVVGRHVRLKRQGREYAGLSPFNAEKSPSFFVNDEKQFFYCFSSGKHGDIFRFLMEIQGLRFPEAVERLAAEAGVALPDASEREAETEEQRQRRLVHEAQMERQRAEDRAKRDAAAAGDRRGRRISAGQTWRESRPIAKTLAQFYLEGRGIDPRFFLDEGVLRFHPKCWHGIAGTHYPALIALVHGWDGLPIGIWRIFLGTGRKGRAAISESTKLGLGDFKDRGGAVRLGGLAEEIGLGEGLETSLAAREISAAMSDLPVWAGLSAGGIASFIAPTGVKRIRVFGDEDLTKKRPGTDQWRTPAGLSAVQALQARYAGTDVEVIDETPKTNSGKVDYVDLLRKIKGLPDEN